MSSEMSKQFLENVNTHAQILLFGLIMSPLCR